MEESHTLEWGKEPFEQTSVREYLKPQAFYMLIVCNLNIAIETNRIPKFYRRF